MSVSIRNSINQRTLIKTIPKDVNNNIQLSSGDELTKQQVDLSEYIKKNKDTSLNILEVSNNLILNRELHAPSTFIIDPQTIGDNSGKVQIKGDLEVLGTQTTIHSNIVDICDNRIRLNASTSLDAGIDISFTDGTSKSFYYNKTDSQWKTDDASLNIGNGVISAGTGIFTSGLTGDVTGNADTATKIASITNSNIVQLAETQTLTNKTLTAPTITGNGAISGIFTGDVTGNADTATALETARTIGGVSFDGTGNINLPGVNIAGNQNTSGTATTATNVTVTANNSANETVYPTFVDGVSDNRGIETDSGLTYNPSSGVLTTAGANITSLTFGGSGTQSTLPSGRGTNGQFLSTNGSGTLSWADAGGGGGSSGWAELYIRKYYSGTTYYRGGYGRITINQGEEKTLECQCVMEVDGNGYGGGGWEGISIGYKASDTNIKIDRADEGWGLLASEFSGYLLTDTSKRFRVAMNRSADQAMTSVGNEIGVQWTSSPPSVGSTSHVTDTHDLETNSGTSHSCKFYQYNYGTNSSGQLLLTNVQYGAYNPGDAGPWHFYASVLVKWPSS